MEDTIKISDIRLDNPLVVEAITSQGYAIVTHAYLEQCNRESAELARIKYRDLSGDWRSGRRTYD